MKLEFIGEEQLAFLRKKNYILEGETPETRFQQIFDRIRFFEETKGYPKGVSERLEEWISKNYISLSTPVLSNFGRPKDPKKSTQPLSVSCNIVGVGNSIQGIYGANLEIAMLSKLGAGVGIDFTHVFDEGTLVSEGFYSNSKLDWIEALVDTTQKVSQGSQRPGYGVPFISILDKEFYKLMVRCDKLNPNEHDVLVGNNAGVLIPTGFMEEMFEGNKDYQKRFFELLRMRKASGQIYIMFEDNMNNNQSPVYEKLGYRVTQSNICQEITTPFFDDKTFACVLGALNLIYWDIIVENPQIIKDLAILLDMIVEDYIILSENVVGLERSRRSAIEKRDIGIGTLGFHELLQMKGLAFGSLESRFLNEKIYSTIRVFAEESTTEMANLLSAPKMCQEADINWRNVSLMAVAPNKSTSFISGCTSAGIEPFMSNIFVKNLAGIQYEFKNRHLKTLLQKYEKDNFETWSSITQNLGSVQHLEFLTDDEKKVFRTFSEISPKDMIDMAADRQKYIDMGQSFNLMFRPNYSMKDIYEIHKYCYEKGLKTLYYAYPSSHAAIERQGESWDACVSCAD